MSQSSPLPSRCASRRHRRRSHRYFDRLPPRPPGLDRHGAGGTRSAHLRHHLARRRTDGHVRLHLGDRPPSCASTPATSTPASRPRPGLATGFKPVGFIELAADEGRLEEYRRVSTFNRYCGVDVQELSPREVADMFPLARTDDLLAGFYVADDGRVNPVDVTMSLAKGARQTGRHHRPGRAACSDVVVRHEAGTGVVSGVSPTTAPSSASTWSTPRACGRGSWARSPACPSRCRRPSTTTSSPSRWKGSTPRGRSSRTPVTTATTARRSAG